MNNSKYLKQKLDRIERREKGIFIINIGDFSTTQYIIEKEKNQRIRVQ